MGTVSSCKLHAILRRCGCVICQMFAASCSALGQFPCTNLVHTQHYSEIRIYRTAQVFKYSPIQPVIRYTKHITLSKPVTNSCRKKILRHTADSDSAKLKEYHLFVFARSRDRRPSQYRWPHGRDRQIVRNPRGRACAAARSPPGMCKWPQKAMKLRSPKLQYLNKLFSIKKIFF